jgi:adhesin transport system membrane fusion protein
VELTQVRVDLARSESDMRNQSDRMNRTEVRAPVDGIVNHVFVNTVGGVAKPGEPLLELTPMNGELVIEAHIRPSDRGELRPGLPAKIKLSAYDYAVYGSLPGRVEEISADTLPDDRGERYYRITVSVQKDFAARVDKPIFPGMTASVDVVVGRRTVLQYVISPVRHFFQSAFREAR